MNRRLFLAALAGAVIDPERLLWAPGRKLISIPKQAPLLPYWQDMTLAEFRKLYPEALKDFSLEERWEKTSSGVYLNGHLTPHREIPIVILRWNTPRPWENQSIGRLHGLRQPKA